MTDNDDDLFSDDSSLGDGGKRDDLTESTRSRIKKLSYESLPSQISTRVPDPRGALDTSFRRGKRSLADTHLTSPGDNGSSHGHTISPPPPIHPPLPPPPSQTPLSKPMYPPPTLSQDEVKTYLNGSNGSYHTSSLPPKPQSSQYKVGYTSPPIAQICSPSEPGSDNFSSANICGNQNNLAPDVIHIDEVEWADPNSKNNPPEQALRPKPPRNHGDPCGCEPIWDASKGEYDKSQTYCISDECVLRACQEECRSNCLAGPLCGNKRITKKQWKKTQVFDAGVKGRGLRILEPASKGDLVAEYCGVAVKRNYLDMLFRRYKMERMLYIMALDNDVYIDARKKGGIARYINHSCDPNCAVHRWTVRGVLRAGIFAIRDIVPGEELSFDYHWKRKRGRAPTKCFCGYSDCRGTLEDKIDESEEDEAYQGHWKDPPQKGRFGREIMNRTVKVFSSAENEYFIADVGKYDESRNMHCLIFRGESEESWTDLNKEKWMILDEEMEKFVIAKKERALPVQNDANTNGGDIGITAASEQTDGQEKNMKNYVIVPTIVKEQIMAKHLVDRCQRYFRVQISVLKCNIEGNTTDLITEENENGSTDKEPDEELLENQGWKFTFTGLEPFKAVEFLEKNICEINETLGKSEQVMSPSDGTRAEPSIAEGGHIFRHEIVIPRCVLDQTKSRMPLLRNNCKGAEISFTHSTSLTKQFAKLIVESTDSSLAQKAQIILWKDLLTLCNACNAPRTATGLFKDLAFLGGELTIKEFELLYPQTSKTKDISLDCSENLRISSGLAAFEDMHRCTVWVQSIEDMGRINSQNKIVTDCSSTRKIFFGCEPSRIGELWGHVRSRVADNSRGVRQFQMEADKYHLPTLSRNFDIRSHGMPINFFDYVSKMSGTSIRIDTFSRNHIRLDGHEYSKNMFVNSSPHIKESPEDRMKIAEEIIQLQIELLRDNTIRHHRWIFGRDWTLSVPFAPRQTDGDDTKSVQSLSPTPLSRSDSKRSTASACFEIVDIIEALKLDTIVGGHASVILYRYCNKVSEQSKTSMSQSKLRDLSLACIFLANKCQKARKWKRLEVLLEAAYRTFYSGAHFDDKSEEARSWEKRVLASEDEVVSTLEFDIFWSGIEWVTSYAIEAGQVAEALAHNITDLALSASSLAAGPQLWLKLGPEYIFVVIAALLSVNIEKLFAALSISPVKLMTAVELMTSHILTQKSSKSRGGKPIHQIFNMEDHALMSRKDEVKRICKNRLLFGMKSSQDQNSTGQSKQYEIISRRYRRRMKLQDIDFNVLKTQLLPSFEYTKAQSLCNIYIEDGSKPGLECVVLEGNWRALAIAENLIMQAVARVNPGKDVASECSELAQMAKLSFEGIPNLDSKSVFVDHQMHGKYGPGTVDMSDVKSSDGWSGIKSMEWKGSVGGKTSIPGQISLSSLHEAGLRWWSWWLQPPIPLNHNCLLCNMFSTRETYGKDDSLHLSHLGKIARSLRTATSGGDVTGLFQRLILHSVENDSSASECDEDPTSLPVSLQRWPSEKCETKERSKGGMSCGFSPSALQEMQLLCQLHYLIPLPQGHPNFVLPISIAADNDKSEAESSTLTSKLSGIASNQTNSDDILSYLHGDSHKKKIEMEKKGMTGHHLVFHPMPIILHKVMIKCKRRRGQTRMRSIPPIVLLSWFHDLLSAAAHCHTNHIVLRTLHPDQIMVDHNGVAKLSGLTRTIVIPKEERGKYLDPLANVRNKNKKNNISEEEMNNNLYVAPELLLGGSRYNQESDMWTIGAVMAHMILGKPLFSGRDRQSKMHAIFKVVGTPSSSNYKEAEDYPYYEKCKPSKKYKKGVEKALKYMLKDNETSDSIKSVLSLLERMLVLDPRKRITAVSALDHSSMKDFMNQSNDESFRTKYVEEWISFKEYVLMPDESDESMDSFGIGGSSQKRKPIDYSMFGASDADDLYNLDGLIPNGSKRQKL